MHRWFERLCKTGFFTSPQPGPLYNNRAALRACTVSYDALSPFWRTIPLVYLYQTIYIYKTLSQSVTYYNSCLYEQVVVVRVHVCICACARARGVRGKLFIRLRISLHADPFSSPTDTRKLQWRVQLTVLPFAKNLSIENGKNKIREIRISVCSHSTERVCFNFILLWRTRWFYIFGAEYPVTPP